MAVDTNKHKQTVAQSQSDTTQVRSTLRWVLIALTIAAVAELLIWRTFSRIGVFIPKDNAPVMKAVYSVSVQIGTILLNFAVLLAIISLALSIWQFRLEGVLGSKANTDEENRRNRALTIGILGIIAVLAASAVLLGVVQNTPLTTIIRVGLIIAFTGLGADLWLKQRDWLVRLFVGLMLIGYWLQLIAKLLHDTIFPLMGVNWQEVVYQPILMAGELAVIINGFVAFVVFTRKTAAQRGLFRDMLEHPKSLIGAVLVVAVFVFLTFITVAESYIVPILGLYALGYEMQWPLSLYIIVLFFFVYTVFYCLGEWKRGSFYRAAGLGLILIFTGGYTFQISDQYLFALVGVMLLARPELLDSNE